MSAAAEPPPADPGRQARLTLLLGALAFCVPGSYALARPLCESLFLGAYSERLLPHAWIAVALLCAAAVAGYNRLAARLPLLRVYLLALGVSAATLAMLLFLRFPGRVFALYLWKDTYIVVLIEAFWSLANLVSVLRTARWTYGFFCFMGSLGGIAGNQAGGALALRAGSGRVLFLVLPVLGVAALLLVPLGGLIGKVHRPAAGEGRGRRTEGGGLRDGLRVLRGSAYLVPLLGVVIVVQVVITLIDYQFNGAVQRAYPDVDRRSALIGDVYTAVEVGSLCLQLLTGPLLRLCGVSATLLGIPVMLGGVVLAGTAAGRLGAVLVEKVASKALDYSILRAAKELLYLPLSYAEKTRGKAMIDMFGYRAAKGGASLLVLGVAALAGGTGPRWLMPGLVLCLIGVWLLLLCIILPRYRARAR